MLGVGSSWLGDVEPSLEGALKSYACTVDAVDEIEDRRVVGLGDCGPNTSKLALRVRFRAGIGPASSSVDRSE